MKTDYWLYFQTFYDDDASEDQGENKEEVEDKEDDKVDPNKTFTQDELNTILKRERKKAEDRTKTTIKELEELKKSKTMTEQDRAKLQTRIEGLQDELLTKEQLSAKEKERLQKQYTKELDTVMQERSTWQQRYTQSEISRSISDAASQQGAFAARDIQALLQPNTQLQEELNDNNEPTGRFIPKVKFADTDKDGKPVTLDLTVAEAVKRMKETPEQYGHLFESTAKSGLGSSGGAGRGTAKDVKTMSPTEYREYRNKQGHRTVR